MTLLSSAERLKDIFTSYVTFFASAVLKDIIAQPSAWETPSHPAERLEDIFIGQVAFFTLPRLAERLETFLIAQMTFTEFYTVIFTSSLSFYRE